MGHLPVATLAALVATGVLAATATAHSGLVSRFPDRGETVAVGLKRVGASFSEPLAQGSIVVRRIRAGVPRGVRARGGVSAADATRLVARSPSGLRRGRYQVSAGTTTADGHHQEYRWRFRVK
jgi:methionine-rich copper-binding protein CopC